MRSSEEREVLVQESEVSKLAVEMQCVKFISNLVTPLAATATQAVRIME
jgi:hypothetical protein